MSFNYKSPSEVLSPIDKIQSVNVIHEEESFSVAKINWDGEDVIGIRWNISHKEYEDTEKQNGSKECVGNPISHGYPTWFILPFKMLDLNFIEQLKEKLN
jgi:hypothetical protein